MKVLHVIPAVASRYGGPSAVLPQMCRALAAKGVQATIATTDADGEVALAVPLGTPTTYEGTSAVFFRRQFSESFKYSRPLARWLAHNVTSFDLVHVHAVLSHACLAAGRACRRAHVPYILRPLGTLDPWSLAQKRLKKRLLLWAAGDRLISGAAAIHFTTDRERALVERAVGCRRGVVIPLGLDDALLSRPRIHRGDAPPYILALSRLHAKKRLELLIETFARIASDDGFGSWRLVIAGDGEPAYVAKLRELAARQAPPGRVEFAGWVEGARKQALLAGAALFAAPSMDENFGVSVVEALACAVPAVLSEHVHLADDIRKAGAGWVTELEPDALERTLRDAMRSIDDRQRRGEAAARLATRYAWSHVACELVELYRRVTDARASEQIGARHAIHREAGR